MARAQQPYRQQPEEDQDCDRTWDTRSNAEKREEREQEAKYQEECQQLDDREHRRQRDQQHMAIWGQMLDQEQMSVTEKQKLNAEDQARFEWGQMSQKDQQRVREQHCKLTVADPRAQQKAQDEARGQRTDPWARGPAANPGPNQGGGRDPGGGGGSWDNYSAASNPGPSQGGGRGSGGGGGAWENRREGDNRRNQKVGGNNYGGSGKGLSYGKGAARIWQERHPVLHNQEDRRKNLPVFVQPMVPEEDFNSMFLIDTREATDAWAGRTLNPFNNLYVQVAAMNAAENLVRAGPNQAPNGHTTTQGVHLATTMIQTTDRYKLTWGVTMDLEANNPCGSWDRFLTQMLQHPAFSPMQIPRMSGKSVTTVDLKLRHKGVWVSHGVFKAYSGENNLSRETMAVNEDALEKMGEHEVNPEDLDMVIVIYAGTRVCAYSFGPGTPVMSLGPQATVYKLSYPDVTFEFRRVLKASPLTMGGDSDSFSFLIRDHTNGLDLRGQRTDAPSDWILISNPRGMGLGDTCEAARRGGGRVEGPDPIFEPAQLWNSHQR
jgi:hypothetical protein